MSAKEPIRLYITHAFKPNEEYSRVFEYLESRDNFYYLNHSDPEKDVSAFTTEALQEEIRRQISPSEVVIFPAGCYADNPRLMDFILKVCQAFDKPILGIQGHGATINLPKEALEATTETVDWNDRMITDTAKRLARGGGAGELDTVEFDISDLDIPEIPKPKN